MPDGYLAVYIYQQDLLLALLLIIAFCQLFNLMIKIKNAILRE